MLPATLGHYRIGRPIGAGGMGEVFLADDVKLGRRVALKVLAHALAADPERRNRFEREARAVAALNHPNIITIYSVEEQDGVLFLTMELVEGKTLTELIPPRGMSLGQLLHVAIPLTDAVGAAHQRGITHRDLKPANVMVTDEGRVKVLDFGLAKLQEESPVDGLTAMTASAPLTSEGRIMGTVAYMSPEQAQGKPVDPRSDVFSLGVLLFEMATGEKPFKGDTNMSVLSAIIKDTPSSVTDLRADLPRDVGRILRRCLAKDPEERYQTAKDLRNDLRSLKEDLDTGVLGRAQTSSHISQTTVLPAPASRMRSTALFALGALAVLAVAGGWWYMRSSAPSATAAFSNITMRRLTNTGAASLAAISPDGRYVVHVDGGFAKPGLWMRQASTASSVQIVPPMAGSYDGLTFSPDSEAVLYVFRPENDPVASLFQIPLLGGPPRKLVENLSTAPAFSPDGARMAFIRGMANGEQVIVLANADGTGERRLASRAEPDVYTPTRVAWSPDGTKIAAFAGEMPKQRARIVLVNVESGKEQAFGDARFDSGGQLVWLGDGSALLFDAIEQYGGRWNWNSHLWSIAYPAGTLRRIAPDLASYSNLAATAGGRTLVAVRDEVRAGLWVAPHGDTARARPITTTSNGREGATGIDWTPDGRIVYSATTQGSWDLWIANGDGSQSRQLTSDPGVENQPRVLPDGKAVVFTSRTLGASEVEVRQIDLDGSNPRQIATGGGIFRGYLQAIGDHLYFKVLQQGRPVAFRVSLGGGPREPLFADPTPLPPHFVMTSVSPDEQWAVGTYEEPGSSGLAVVSIGGVGPVRRFPFTYTPGLGFGATWAPGGHALENLVVRDGDTNLWRFPLDGSAPRPITTFTSEEILNYRWSRDGKTLAMSRGAQFSDVVLITSDETDRKDTGSR
jgi:serine/threonine protein kinase/dipeptidyl aminopeptidase/acylaminoacyl peptidase